MKKKYESIRSSGSQLMLSPTNSFSLLLNRIKKVNRYHSNDSIATKLFIIVFTTYIFFLAIPIEYSK